MDEERIRRCKLVRRLRRSRLVKELRKQKMTAFRANLKRGVNLLNEVNKGLQAVKDRKYAPITPPKKKQIRIVVEDLKKGCEHCLNKPAVIYSPVFKQNLCLDCEDKLTIDVGAMAFSKLKKKMKGSK